MLDASRFSAIKVEQDEGVVLVTFNEPERKNPITLDVMRELGQVLDLMRVDADCRVLVLTGAGDAFSSGGNVKEFKDRQVAGQPQLTQRPPWSIPTMTVEERLEQRRMSGLRLMEGIAYLNKPTIAAINGVAVGAGMDIALACDMRFMAEEARLASIYIRRGLIPVDGGMYWLPRLVGVARAFELMMTGDFIDARRAEQIGLVNRVAPRESILAEAMAMAKRLARGPSVSFQVMKYCVRNSQFLEFKDAIRLYYQGVELLHTTDDYKEAVTAFLEKRDPVFKGC